MRRATLWDEWGLDPGRFLTDLGGSANLNLLVGGKDSQFVARVYRPFITAARLAGLPSARRTLASHGVPAIEPIPTVAGRPCAPTAGADGDQSVA